jgi:hypothetical protein
MITLRQALLTALSVLWLFYESRVHSFCVAKCGERDGDYFMTVQSGACKQFRNTFAKAGLDCDRAELELDSRVIELRVWQCHAQEHVLLSSWLRISVVSLVGLWFAYQLYERKQFRNTQLELQRRQLKSSNKLSESLLLAPSKRISQKIGPAHIEPYIEEVN